MDTDKAYLLGLIIGGGVFGNAEDDDELSGKRPKGYFQIVERHSNNDAGLTVEIRKPDLLTPLVIVGNGRGALIGARNPEVYKRLVTVSPDNEYKLLVRRITEEDLSNAR